MTQKPDYEALKQRVNELERESLDRKRAEEKTRENEERYRTLFENSRDAIVITTREGEIVDINQAALELFGYTGEEIMGVSFREFYVRPKDGRRFQQTIEKKGSVLDYEVDLLKKDGTKLNCLLSVTVRLAGDGTVLEYQGIIRNISHRKRSEDALRESEERFRMLAEDAPFGISIMKPDRCFEYFNPKFTEIFGYTLDDLPDKETWFKNAYPDEDYKKKVVSAWKEDLVERVEIGQIKPRVFQVRCKNDQDKIIHFRAVALKDGKQFLTYEDITARKEAEEAVRQSEQRYRFLVENVLFGLFICEMPSGRFLFLNQRVLEIFGYGKDEGLDMSIWDVINPDEHNLMKKRVEAKIKGEIPPSDSVIYTAIKKDGSHFRVEINASPVTYQGIPVMQGVVVDVTEKEVLENQLQQAQKMEAIGTLAGGIAHDFNNLLMAVQGNTSLMLLDVDSGHPHHEKLKNIEQYVQRGADLTKQLLGFARGGKYEVRPTDLNELMMMSSKMFGRTKKEITIQSKYQQGLWTVEVDKGQIEQVLLNLYVNAWQAMPGGGKLFIQTENVILDETYAKLFKVEPGKYVKIIVMDTGVGMDASTSQRVFDPFFTTKEMGRGTGLGLASAYGIIKNHGGVIYVYSEIGEGTTFSIYLPATVSEVGSQKSEVSDDVGHGDETILLVDDEEMIIDVGGQMLEKLGFEVLIARNGKEAMEVYKKNRDRIDIVVLDMIMPGMGGGETYDKLKENNPDIKILLSSGYSIDGQATEILDRGCNGFIQKPFDFEKLSHSIRQIIDGD